MYGIGVLRTLIRWPLILPLDPWSSLLLRRCLLPLDTSLHTAWRFVANPPDQSSSDEDWYALHDGGHIKPEAVLVDPDQIAKVREAEGTLASFFEALRDAGIRSEM